MFCAALTVSVKLDEVAASLGLIMGSSYPITVFHAERKTPASHFRLSTSLALYCPWYDHCQVCQVLAAL